MKKAEDRAREIYPGEEKENGVARFFFADGYEQAVKDMLAESVEGCVTMYANAVYPTLIGIREKIGDTGEKVHVLIIREAEQ